MKNVRTSLNHNYQLTSDPFPRIPGIATRAYHRKFSQA